MNIIITIPDVSLPYIIDGIAANTGYISGSGVTKGQWAQQKLVNWIKFNAYYGQARIATPVDSVNISSSLG